MDTTAPSEAGSQSEVTRLLEQWSHGNEDALRQLTPLVYGELRRIAGGYLLHERRQHTLQTTALVHEAYIRLVERDHPEWQSRAHFTAVAARYMRQILVDHARRRNAAKRGAGQEIAEVSDAAACAVQRPAILLALDDALEELARVDAEKARIVEMRFFGGMTQEEIAAVLGIHVNTAARHLRLAQAWLKSVLAP